MATNICNTSFPRLQIQVPMPWSEWHGTCSATPPLRPKELFLGMSYMNYWAALFILPLPAPHHDDKNVLPKATDPNGTKVTYSPQLPQQWSQAGFHKKSKSWSLLVFLRGSLPIQLPGSSNLSTKKYSPRKVIYYRNNSCSSHLGLWLKCRFWLISSGSWDSASLTSSWGTEAAGHWTTLWEVGSYST